MCLGLNLCYASAMSRSNDFSHATATPVPPGQMGMFFFHLDYAQQPWRLPPSGQVHLHWLHQQDIQHGGSSGQILITHDVLTWQETYPK